MPVLDILLTLFTMAISILIYKIRKHKEESNSHKEETKNRLTKLETKVDDLIEFLTTR